MTFNISKNALFAEALIESNGNATEAARRVFKLGSKGGKHHQRTAESMGSEYLRKPEVKKHLTQLLECVLMNRNWVLLRLKRFAEQTTDLHLALKSVTLVVQMLRQLPEQKMSNSNPIEPKRKTIFMLSPPSLPPNGVPSPALEKQWREMGWTPEWSSAYQRSEKGE